MPPQLTFDWTPSPPQADAPPAHEKSPVKLDAPTEKAVQQLMVRLLIAVVRALAEAPDDR